MSFRIPTPAPTVIEEYNVSTTELVAVSTYTNTTSIDNTGTTTATREVAGTEEVTGVVTSTTTASSTSTSGGVATDYRYALRAESPGYADSVAGALNANGEYYTDAGFQFNGEDIVYIQIEDTENFNETTVVVSEAVAVSEEVYVVDVIEAVPVTLPDTIYVEETTVSVATRTKLAE